MYGGPEGSNTNKKETTNKKNGQANKKLENVNEKKKTQIKLSTTQTKMQKANKKHGSKQEMRRALVLASHHGPVVRTLVSTNPGLNFNVGSFFIYIKSALLDNFVYFFSISNHQIVGKENSTELAF